MASNFLSAWFWDTGTGLVPIVGFYSILFAVMILGFGLASKIRSRVKSSWLMAMGILLNAIFLGLLLVLRGSAKPYFVPLAVLEGLAATFYWLGLYVLASAWVRPDQASWYNGWTGTLEAVLGLVAPPASGWIIASMAGLAGYHAVFGIAFFSLITCLILILGGRNASARQILQEESFTSPVLPPDWRPLMWSFWALGLRDGIYYFVPNLLLFILSRSTILLGLFVASEALLQGILFWALARFTHPRVQTRSLFLAAAISLSALAAAFQPLNTWILFALGMVISLAYPPFKVALETSALVSIRASGHNENDLVQLTGIKEVWINSGRVISLLLVLAAVFTASYFEIQDFRWILAGWGLVPTVILITYRSSRKRATHPS
jgi:YQGE family putative transporter